MKITPQGLIGLGIGLMIGALLVGVNVTGRMTPGEIEQAAREMGMIYPAERTVQEALNEEGEQ